MRLTNAHRNNGITQISNMRSFNGSWQVEIELKNAEGMENIDRKSNGTNFRPYTKSHKNEILASFNKQAVRNPVLIWTGKGLKSIDGRHTIAALIEAGFNKITADVHFKMTQQEAAGVFYELTQNSKRMGPWDAYAAALEGGYTFAVDIDAALIRFGYSIPNDDGFNTKNADFEGFTPLFDSHQKGNNFLHAFLTVLRSWKRGDERLQDKARRNAFQRGLFDFLTEHIGERSARDWANILGKRSASEINERAVDIGGDRIDRSHYKMAFEQVANIGANRRRVAA